MIYTVENYLDHNDNCVPQILLQEIDNIELNDLLILGKVENKNC